MLSFCMVRMFLAKIAITWILITSPSSLILGPITHLIHNFLPGSSNLNLVIPALTTELVVDTTLLVGVWRNALPCLVPWLVINIMVVLGLGAGVMALLSSIILLPVNLDSDTGSDMETALQDIKSFLMVIILNIFLLLQMINVSAVIHIFVEMKESVDDRAPTTEMHKEAGRSVTVQEDASQLDLLRNEERPASSQDPAIINDNDSFDSFLYEDVP